LEREPDRGWRRADDAHLQADADSDADSDDDSHSDADADAVILDRGQP
jgi:hypothetical protein